MTQSVYERVRDRLDTLGNGFPATESGVELKILKKLFEDPREAETWLLLEIMPESIEVIAGKLDLAVDQAQQVIDEMGKKGLVHAASDQGTDLYHIVPFLEGLYEDAFAFGRLDQELSVYFEEYLPEFAKRYGRTDNPEMRIIPVRKEITAESTVYTHDDARAMIESGSFFEIVPCVCRQQTKEAGRPCPQGYTVEDSCIVIAGSEIPVSEGYFPGSERFVPEGGRSVTKKEALEHLEQTVTAGLVQLSYNTMGGDTFLCNCCSCCCGILRGVVEFGEPNMVARSNYVAQIDPDLCIACGLCVEDCQVRAIDEGDDSSRVTPDLCIGCGICEANCPEEAIGMVLRPESERTDPPFQDRWDFFRQTSQSSSS